MSNSNVVRIKDDDGSIYEGTLKDDKRHGRGIFSHISGAILKGEWKNDSPKKPSNSNPDLSHQ
jgi:hypothetical protein